MRKNGDLHEKVTRAILGPQEQPQDPGGLEAYAALCELLWPRFKAAKCVREAGRLTIRVIGGYYVCMLHCPSEGLQTQIVSTTLVGLLDHIEAHLGETSTIWLPDYESQKKARQQAKG